MSDKLLRFEDGKVTIGGKDLLASSANLSISPKLEAERVYGDYDSSIVGAKTEFVKFAPVGGLTGKLSINFYISSDKFTVDGNPNSIERMFDIVAGMDERSINNNIVGRYSFNNMYLNSFGFEMSPFKMVMATASYDIYGSIERVIDQRFRQSDVNFAHGLKSFGNILASGVEQNEFEISKLKYTIVVNRKIHDQIRANENTSINTSPSGTVPVRCSVENIEKEMRIEGNEIIEKINIYGGKQTSSVAEGIEDSKIEAFLLSLEGEKVARFSAKGKIQTQDIAISEGQHAMANITIKEIIK